MTTIPNTAPQSLARPLQGAIVQQAPGPAQPAAAGGQLSSLDPVKLLNRHKWLLIAAAVVGVGMGQAAYIVLKRMYPVWKPTALYTVSAPFEKISDSPSLSVNQEEMNRFMMTQTRLMTSDTVLTRVVEDPDLARNAKDWAKEFSADGMTITDKTGALERLKKIVNARVVAQTTLIELSATSKYKFDATAIVELTREKYEEQVRRMSDELMQSQINSLERQIAASNSEIERLQRMREELMRRENLDTIDDRAQATLTSLSQTNAELLSVTQNLQSVTTQREQLEADRNSPGGIPFGDGMLAEVERDPLILQAKGQLTAMESDRQSLRNQGISPQHRSFVRIENAIRGQEQTIEDLRQRLLRQLFDGQLDQITRVQAQLAAQRTQLAEQADSLQRRLTDLTRLISQLRDLDAQIDQIVSGKGDLQRQLSNLNGIKALAQSQRVMLFQKETPPNQLAFPKLAFMLPAGLLVSVGLVGAFVLVREILDQRIKGPSDITIIPRTRLLGWIPLASEDPSGEGAVETAVRDRSTGVVAESGRQLRSAIEKRSHGTSPQVVLVVSGMPGSGTTTVVCNLGLAAAAADKRVLLLDTNFRRPAMHKVFGLQESPGLADALSSQRPFEECVQRTTSPNLDVMTCGSKELRHVERFGTNTMNQLLAHARERYDVILLDTAPAIVGGDYLVLSQRVDASILVVRAMGEKRGLVARVRNELGEAPSMFLGVVVNAVRHAAGGYMKRNIRAAQEYQSTS